VTGDTLLLFAVVAVPILLLKFVLIRRFGFLALAVDFTVMGVIAAAPVTASGWLAERVLPFQLIPIGLAAWALWVILSARGVAEGESEALA
jgi:hypothetical protein